MRHVMLSSFLALLLSGQSGVHAATFTTKQLRDSSWLIFVEGEFEFGDDRKFVAQALALDEALVVFQSNGGNLHSGIEIGKAIRLKGFGTYVPDNQYCASACAIAWLGGRIRLMSNTAKVGFHAAYKEADGQKVATSAGNALVGAYLSQLGMPESAIVYVTSTAPDDIKWLSFSDAQRYGIDVKLFDLTGEKPAAPIRIAPTPSASPYGGNWATYGDWIQILSRSSLLEASQAAVEYRKQFENTYVFRYANGWYAVVIGPFPFGEGAAQRDMMVKAGAIPADSRIAPPDKMLELAYGGTPKPATKVSVNTAPLSTPLETQAKAFFISFQTSWSQDNPTAINALERAYSNQIVYYGNAKPKSLVMFEKREFATRWPSRKYTAHAESTSVQCNAASGVCTASGIVEWSAESTARQASSVGMAQLELTLQWSANGFIVIGESGKVLSRKNRKL